MENTQSQIIKILETKTGLKQQVFTNTLNAFSNLKKLLAQTADEYNEALKSSVGDNLFYFKDKGDFLAELKVAGDVLIFYMHSNIFDFDRNHPVRKSKYMKKDPTAGYSGIINIYNFLADSFKYERLEDLGYLVARIFVNKNNHFFVEGKRQDKSAVLQFGTQELTMETLKIITEAAINYSLQFDLLVPPYDQVKMTTVEHISEKNYQGKLRTGKRLGFGFRSDDIQGDTAKYTGA